MQFSTSFCAKNSLHSPGYFDNMLCFVIFLGCFQFNCQCNSKRHFSEVDFLYFFVSTEELHACCTWSASCDVCMLTAEESDWGAASCFVQLHGHLCTLWYILDLFLYQCRCHETVVFCACDRSVLSNRFMRKKNLDSFVFCLF